MARALKNPDTEPTYLEFFGMTQPPFAQLSGQSQIFNSEQYSLMTAHLASATKQTDCLVVICGADGSGKTTLLNRYTDSLGSDVSFATFDETCTNGTQFYCSFLQQLGFNEISGTLRELRRITKEFLICRSKAGDPVLVIIDNAHLVSPTVFEQLRWIAETRVDDQRVLSIVLAGNADLPRIMKSPAMSSIRFRNHVDFNIRVYTEEETEDYVRHRLRLAGGFDAAKFSNEARPLIYRLTGGIPNSINKLCNAVLTEAYTQETRVISADLVRRVAGSSQTIPIDTPSKSKGRRKTDPDFGTYVPDEQDEERIAAREAPTQEDAGKSVAKPAVPDVDVKKLLEQVAQLSEQIGEIKSERKQALADVKYRDKEIRELKGHLVDIRAERKLAHADVSAREKDVSNLREQLSELKAERKLALADIKMRDKDIIGLQKELQRQTKETEKLAGVVASDAEEVKRLKTTISDSSQLAREREKAAAGITSDLKKEKRAVKRANSDLAKIRKKIEKSDEVKSQLQESVNVLSRELKEANKRVTRTHALEKNAEDLKEKIETKSGQLSAREQAIADLEESLRTSQTECESLRATTDELNGLKESVSEKDLRILELEAELDAASKEMQESLGKAKEERNSMRSNAEALKDLEGTVSKKEARIVELETELASTSEEMEKSLQETQEERDSLRSSADALKELEGSVSEKDLRILELQAELDAANKEMKESLRKAKEERNSMRSNADALKDLEGTVSKKEARIVELETELASTSEEMEKSLQETQEERDSLRSSVDKLKDLEESVSEKDQRILELEAELASANEEIIDAQELLAKESTASRPKKSGSKKKGKRRARTVSCIEVVKGRKVVQVMPLGGEESRIMIGRSDDSELCLDSKYVSRHHALIFCGENQVFIEDLNSFNGTIVNSKTITRCELHPDDNVIIGDFQIRPRQG